MLIYPGTIAMAIRRERTITCALQWPDDRRAQPLATADIFTNLANFYRFRVRRSEIGVYFTFG